MPWSLINGRLGGADAFLNILLFIPLAAGLRLTGLTRWRAFASAVAATITVEALQIHVIAGRDASLGDVISNSLGAVVGILLVDNRLAIVAPEPVRAWRLSLCGAVAWLALVALGGWAMRPAFTAAQQWAEIAPDLYQVELFNGTVLRASVNGAPVASPATKVNVGSLSSGPFADTLRISATAIPASPTYDIAPIVAVGTRDERMMVALGQTGRSLALQLRVNSARMRTRVPMVIIPNVFPGGGDDGSERARAVDTLGIAGQIFGGKRLVLDVESEPRAHAELELNPFLLWVTVMPFGPFAASRMMLLTVAWIGLLVAPFTYWGGRATRRGGADGSRYPRATDVRIVMVNCVALAIGLAVIPPMFGFGVAPRSYWLAATLSAVIAFVIGARAGNSEIAATAKSLASSR